MMMLVVMLFVLFVWFLTHDLSHSGSWGELLSLNLNDGGENGMTFPVRLLYMQFAAEMFYFLSHCT